MEAAVIMQMCSRNKRPFGVRTQKMEDRDWWRTWSFVIDERRAQSEGYDITPVQGNLYATEEYPGCPYCGSYNFVQCNKCRKISCWNKETRMTCPWCSNDMNNIVTATEKFDLSGGDI